MKPTHYEVLGVSPDAGPQEVRRAYREMALKHHPDRSSDPRSADIFIRVTEAYEVLRDLERRRHYDAMLAAERQRRLEAARPKPAPTPPQPAPRAPSPPRAAPTARPGTNDRVQKLTGLLKSGRIMEAETLANELIQSDARNPVPYAVLGDIASMRGQVRRAAEMYSYAAQMDPRNPIYQRRHEEMLKAVRNPTPDARIQPRPTAVSPIFGAVVILIATCAYVIVGDEPPLFAGLPIVSTLTLGLMGMLMIAGITAGACLSIANLVDRFTAVRITSVLPVPPTVLLLLLALVNFWLAVVVYAAVGITQDAFNASTSRLMTAVAIVTIVLALACGIAPRIDGVQCLLWGGNVAYLGALCGWLVADGLRESEG